MRILGLEEIPWNKIPEEKRKVFLRVDYNVPLKDGKVLDDFRIKQSLASIRKLLELNCLIVIGAHLGRPQKLSEEDRKKKLSLLPIAEHLAGLLEMNVTFSEDVTGPGVKKLIFDGRPGQIIVVENLRFDSREESDDRFFGEELLEDRTIFINDAFGACHRAHASIHAVAEKAKFKAMGRLLQKEYQCLSKVLHEPEKPQMAILGGAKIEDKIKVIEALMTSCQVICVGGRMGLAFLAAQGVDLGASKLPKESIQLAKRLLADAKKQNVEMLFPEDGEAATHIESKDSRSIELSLDSKLAADMQIFDIGPKTLEAWKKKLSAAKSIVWNGPMGVFENPSFAKGTLGIVDFLVSVADKVKTVAGGGETVAAITQKQALDKIFHVSTGGGAMLEFLEGKELPGLEALKMREREIAELQTGRMAS